MIARLMEPFVLIVMFLKACVLFHIMLSIQRDLNSCVVFDTQ